MTHEVIESSFTLAIILWTLAILLEICLIVIAYSLYEKTELKQKEQDLRLNDLENNYN